MPTAGADEFEIRPSRHPGVLRYAPAALFAVFISICAGTVGLWSANSGDVGTAVVVWLGAFGSMALIAAAALWTYARNARIYVAGGRLGSIDMWGREKVWPSSSIKAAVFGAVSLTANPSFIPEISVTLVLDERGSSVMSLSSLMWADSDLDRLWLALGLTPTQGWSEALTPDELRRRYPGAVAELPRTSLPAGQLIAIITFSFTLAIVLSICLIR